MVRLLARDDLEAFQAYRTDARLAVYQEWSPMSAPEATAFLAAMSAVTDLVPGDWIQLGIADAVSNELIGDIGLRLDADRHGTEIGFTLSSARHGQGLASEAVRTALDLVFTCAPIEEVRAVTDARNAASIRLLQRVGFSQVSERQAVARGERCTEYLYRARRRRETRGGGRS